MIDPGKILVLRDGHLGDLLMVTPLLRALRENWPQAELEVLTSDYGARVLERNTRVRMVHGYDRAQGPLRRFLDLRSLPGPYELLLVLETDPQYTRWSRLIPARHRIGYANSADRLYDARLEWDPQRHTIHNHLALARVAGVSERNCHEEMELSVTDEDLARADKHLRREGLSEGQPFVLLHAPCNSHGTLRQWPSFHFAELADRVQSELGYRVMINGSAEEAHVVDAVVALSTTPVLTNTDPDLGLMLGLTARSSLFVGGDTGPLRMASALGRPLLGLFGSTSPVQAGPLGPSERVGTLSAQLACSPCEGRELPETAVCLKKGMADCMISLTVDRVLESCRELLEPV